MLAKAMAKATHWVPANALMLKPNPLIRIISPSAMMVNCW